MSNLSFLSTKLSEKIEDFDFERELTCKKRIYLHSIMWLSFALMLFLSYKIAYHLTTFNSIILTIRMAVSNMTIFYFFFYAIAPRLFKQNLGTIIIGLVLLFPILIAIWLWTTYIFSLFYHSLNFEIESGELKGAIAASAEQTFWGAVSPSRIISQAIIFVSLLSPFFFVKILFEISKLYSKSLKISKQNSQLQIQNINIERDFLKSQLNPHFLFNTLNNLYSLSLKKDNKIPDVILNLSDTMSYTLYESNAERVPLTKEIDFIKNYIELEKMRHGTQKNISVTFPTEEDCLGKMIAPLLTFSLIENAFKYGLKNKDKAFVNLKIEIRDDTFTFNIENDYINKFESKKVGGIGLENLKKRLQLIYPEKHNLRITNEENKFLVKLEIEI
ncbi:sensor histidine kinase [Soonwooa sp.]|uniref:sensor histidine kinase n=1 Tax=Soonwooa sp. TaxID=1938592 RepID=UPI0026218162|nr:sensor histidine kinase [Soonwooa sp.]